MRAIEVLVEDGRYDRQELISWWDQSRLLAARVLVVGAGALGNEIAKNLALVGAGAVEVVDMDRIENSNLARCAMFVDADRGRLKAEVLAERISALNPDVSAVAHSCTVQRLGAGYLRHFDLVIAGLDNREARLWVGNVCRRLGITWVDGAIEGLRGLARVFPPSGACYECTLSEDDRQILAQRRSCALLTAEQMATGHVPTNATTSSVIAGVEVQEAIKVLVGRADLLALANRAWMFTGDVMDSYLVDYTEDEYCLSHDDLGAIRPFEATAGSTAGDLLRQVAGDDPEAVLSFEDDVVTASRCQSCGAVAEVMRIRSSLGPGDGECVCGEELTLEAVRTITAADPLAAVPLQRLQPAREELVTIRSAVARTAVAITYEDAR